jgi:hypothetical protein
MAPLAVSPFLVTNVAHSVEAVHTIIDPLLLLNNLSFGFFGSLALFRLSSRNDIILRFLL